MVYGKIVFDPGYLGNGINLSGRYGSIIERKRELGYTFFRQSKLVKLQNKSDLEILFEGDVLFNQYYSNKPKSSYTCKISISRKARELAYVSDKGMINGYEIDGQALFKFNAKPK